ncbi:MAG: S53 family peptidase [Bacilli bacterium]
MFKLKTALLAAPLAAGMLFTGMPAAVSAHFQGFQGLLATGHAARPNISLIQPVTDLGPADPNQIVSMSIVLKAQHTAQLANYIAQTVNPASANYHKFLSVSQFRGLYAPPATDVSQLIGYLTAHRIQSYAYADGLLVKAVGPASAFEQLFKIQIENLSINGSTFYASSKAIAFPKAFAKLVLTTVGLSNYTAAAPQMMMLSKSQQPATASAPVKLPKHGTATGVPGQYTVGDVARIYHINGLYKKGITGKGQTIGIATFANFHVQDAYHYWNAIHLKYKPNRIRQVFVDGGGALGKAAGSGETALDVEQSGGIAPNANIVVYDAANTDQGFVDVFYQAASDNVVNTLSVSWGSPELFYLASQQTGQLQALHQAFMEAAVQGISTFAAAGDSGAFDVNAAVPYPFVSKVVSVDAPSSDPYVTATGGTTLAGSIHLKKGWVNVPSTRAWSWKYLANYTNTNYGPLALYTRNIFPVGGGGGVSSVWPVPWYQKGIPSIQKTPPGQQLIDFTQTPPSVYYQLHGGFAGRNTPDIAMNADPYTGYLLYSTPDGGWIKNVGGTSMAAPQMNGITALLGQYLGSRIGLLNPALYAMAKANAYGPNGPLTAITAGSNWYYSAIPGYNQATGVGSPNVTNMAVWMKAQQQQLAAGKAATAVAGSAKGTGGGGR